ncbi:MAG: hypothetical protein SOY06_08415 [Prevotella sp.]|nr:hypothetical protein [Bacteroidales bacterium]MDY4229852.1 hypothetical protein [Prevotella sp.]
MKKMIFCLIAAMMLLGTVNSNAQRFERYDKHRKEMRKDGDRHHRHHRHHHKRKVVVEHRCDRAPERVYVVRECPRPVRVVEAPPPPPRHRPRRASPTTNTVVAAAVGVAVGAMITAAAR